jgi:twinkle protein
VSDVEVIAQRVVELPDGHSRVECPACGPDRKKQGEKTLSVDIQGGFAVWLCHHCDSAGRTSVDVEVMPEPVSIPQAEQPDTSGLSDQQVEWLKSRSISAETADQCGVVAGDVYVSRRSSKVNCIGFPYRNADGTEAVKWRDSQKNFTQTGAAQSLWRIDEFTGGDLVICEGEMDVLAFQEAGIFATSVPNGAPSTEVKNISSKKFSYLWDAKSKLEDAERIILCTDRDEPGKALANEIARRVGKARCWKVPIPEDCKDMNDVLIDHGKDGVVKAVESATPWPIGGLRDPGEYRDDALTLFRGGFEPGAGCGIESVDNIFRVLPQTLTVITGVPGSGKSTFLTWMSVQLARDKDWRCAVLSAETSSQVHLIQMASVLKKKPYRGDDRMSEDELNDAIDWLGERFVFLDEADTEITSVLDRTHAAVLRNGIRLLIVDPYNFLTGSLDDVTGINKMLVALKAFAVEHGIAIWLVAHPVKMYRRDDGKTPVPTGYDVAGSSAFFNVADAGITVSRKENGQSLVTCWKARFPWVGQTGSASIEFDLNTLQFSESAFDLDFPFDVEDLEFD